jgi:hypothetical protein
MTDGRPAKSNERPDGVDAVACIAVELERLSESSLPADARAAFRRAARALYQQPAGRHPTNDRKLLRDAAQLLAMGLAKSENDALAKVAGTIATDYQSLKTTIERLRRKRRKSSLEII